MRSYVPSELRGKMYKIPVASHSFLNDWDNCQHKAFRKHIKKDLPREPQSDAMKWGNTVHTAFEKRLKGEPWPNCSGRPFPAVLPKAPPATPWVRRVPLKR